MSSNQQLPILGNDMRAMRRELADASDQHVLAVLRLVDQLPDRSQANGLLAPLTGRLRQLRTLRPLRFARLLITPMEPVLVNPQVWRPGAPQLPRNALQEVVSIVEQALPFIVQEVDRAAAQSPPTNRELPCAAGRILWADAACVLKAAPLPPLWGNTGLPNSAFKELAGACGTVLGAAWRLRLLADPAIAGNELNENLTNLLAAAEAEGPVDWGMQLTIMVQRFPHASAPLHAATAARASRALRQAAEIALEAAWSWLQADPDGLDAQNLPDATAQLRRQIDLLTALAADTTHRRRATALQPDLRTASLQRFEAALESLLRAPLRAYSPADDPETFSSGLEEDARSVRRLEAECRRLGAGAALDAQLADTAALIIGCRDMPSMDRARLIEILLGTHMAMRLNASL